MLIPKGVKPKRIKAKEWEQMKYILFLKRLFPDCEIHHLIHNKRPDRRRKDDRLVFPLLPGQHKEFHDTVGNERKFFAAIGVDDPYNVAGMAWELWVVMGEAAESEISVIYSVRNKPHGD